MQAINERIKELDIQDCKVRVSNVDSQESFKNIVVQVIGEMSNKAAPHRKFVQTFVLAEQPNGYFVLNDIFRYINEDEEELEAEDPSVTEAVVPEEPVETLTTSTAVDMVDEKLEAEKDANNASPEEPVRTPPAPNGTEAEESSPLEPATEESTIAHTVEVTDDKVAEDTAEKAVVEDEVEPEKPRDPDPTPVASPPKQAPAAAVQAPVPAVPPKPAAPKTWANMVAANRVAANANPNPASSAPSQPKNAPAPTTQPTTPPAITGEEALGKAQPNGNTGWQTAGTDNNRRQARGQSISGNNERETILGYVKNVTEKVDASILKNTLNSFGKLAYFDVSRQKVFYSSILKSCTHTDFCNRIALLLNSKPLQGIRPPWPPVPLRLGVSKSLSKNVVHVKLEASTRGAECAVAAEMAALAARDEVIS